MTIRYTPEQAERLLEEQLRKLRYANQTEKLGHANDEDIPDEGPESKLAGKIQSWAKQNGFRFNASGKAARREGSLSLVGRIELCSSRVPR